MAPDYPASFTNLTRELRRLPGIGPRSAERIALWLLGSKDARPAQLAGALTTAAESIRPCKRCGFFSVNDLCEIFLPLERTGHFAGLYHALGGRLAPLDHVGPDQIRIDELVRRVVEESPSEIILALSADVEGEATTNYLVEILTPLGVPVSRIAHGLPAGGGLEHADQITLQRALSGRRRADGSVKG